MDRDRGIPALVARCSLTGAEAGAGKLQIALTGAKVSADKGSGRFMLFIEFIVVQDECIGMCRNVTECFIPPGCNGKVL
ncbi:MAG TPA: hypothetical protein VFD91_08130 [Mariniphaga sp.]|nr:hypothetical protein [Mariniphaga sp.]